MTKLRIALLAGGLAMLAGLGIVAKAQVPPGTLIVTSLVGSFSFPINTAGPQSAVVKLSGGTFTCVSASTVVVANTNWDSGSLLETTLKTIGGTPGAKTVTSVTAGTGFSITCASGDTSTYNYLIMG